MLDTLTGFFKSLNKKEKIIVISSASALAVVLIAVVLLISFCGATKHHHKYQYSMEMENGKFNVIGRCFGEEGECRERDIFFADVKPVATEVKAATCLAKGEILHTYKIDDTELTYTTYTDIVEHRLNGKPVSELANADGSFNYDVPGVKISAGMSYVCDDTVNGYYICDDCKEVSSVQVYKPHISKEIPGKFATCTTSGITRVVCQDCGISRGNDIIVPALGHSYKYTLTLGDNAKLTHKCQREDCGETKTESVINYTVTDSTSGTCAKKATTTYKVTTASGTYEGIVIESDEVVPHTLGGAPAKDTYEYGAAGIKYFADSNIECGTTGRAYFNCEVCGGIAEVKVTKPEHSYVLNYSTLVKPDYDSVGSINYECTNIGCDLFINIKLPVVKTTGADKNATVISAATEVKDEIAKYQFTNDLPFDVTIVINEVSSAPAIGHKYTYKFANDAATNVGASVVGTCSNADCLEPVIVEKVSKSEKISDLPANCTGPAQKVYKVVTESGKEIKINVANGTEKGENHILNGVDATTLAYSKDKYYDTVPGIKIFGGVELTCDQTANGYYTCEACGGIVQVEVKGAHEWSLEVKTAPSTTNGGTGILSCSKCKTSNDITIDKIVTEGAGKNAEKLSETTTTITYNYTIVLSAEEKIVVKLTIPKS